MRLQPRGLATWRLPWKLPSGAIVTRLTTTTWEGYPICTQGTAPDMLGTNKGKLAFSDTEAPGRPTCKRVTWSLRDEVAEVKTGDRYEGSYLNVYEGAMWHHFGKEGGRRDKPSRGTPETITRTSISHEATTEEIQLVLNTLIYKNGGDLDKTKSGDPDKFGYVLAVGNDKQRPWQGMSARRIPFVDRAWVDTLTVRDVILCPAEMSGPRSVISGGVVSSIHDLRGKLEREAAGEEIPEFETLKKFCVPHQYSGCLTPVLADRDNLTKFLAQANLVLTQGGGECGASVQLTLLMLGELQRHPLLLMEDLRRTPFTTAREVRERMPDQGLCFRVRRPDPGPHELFPLHASEMSANFHAIWASMATSTFPYIGLPLATHIGEVTPWPFSPNHGSLLATIAHAMEHGLQAGTAQLDIPGRVLRALATHDDGDLLESSDEDQGPGSTQTEWANVHDDEAGPSRTQPTEGDE